MEVVGVIPAAGYATRLQPLECSKEVLPVGGRPIMDYLAERMRAGGSTRVRVVTRPEKTDVIAHAEELGAEVVLGYPVTVSASFLAGTEGLAPTDIVLVGFPDTLWEPRDAYAQLVHAVREDCEVALGLFRIRAADLPRSDVIAFDESGAISGIAVKPSDPPSEWIWGCAAARANSLDRLAQTEWPGEYFDLLCREGASVHGIRLSDDWLDVGTKETLAQASSLDPRYL